MISQFPIGWKNWKTVCSGCCPPVVPNIFHSLDPRKEHIMIGKEAVAFAETIPHLSPPSASFIFTTVGGQSRLLNHLLLPIMSYGYSSTSLGLCNLTLFYFLPDTPLCGSVRKESAGKSSSLVSQFIDFCPLLRCNTNFYPQ